ncbi:hypothetical protein EYW49_07890 [Siculibacillus lacustris]|uniref:Uncharacterized protein n=1 Tax=Siculibacillus lacustris TaxID=1549641 RepID=A0A4Q9VSR5_9HYPH|nr:hypothetical protein [Siculibacillus lacustris]TBW39042.1 hypothetical protein EYW49_07890 [Siculibacillus lacustris]
MRTFIHFLIAVIGFALMADGVYRIGRDHGSDDGESAAAAMALVEAQAAIGPPAFAQAMASAGSHGALTEAIEVVRVTPSNPPTLPPPVAVAPPRIGASNGVGDLVAQFSSTAKVGTTMQGVGEPPSIRSAQEVELSLALDRCRVDTTRARDEKAAVDRNLAAVIGILAARTEAGKPTPKTWQDRLFDFLAKQASNAGRVLLGAVLASFRRILAAVTARVTPTDARRGGQAPRAEP